MTFQPDLAIVGKDLFFGVDGDVDLGSMAMDFELAYPTRGQNFSDRFRSGTNFCFRMNGANKKGRFQGDRPGEKGFLKDSR
jgi:hypothetical protein